MVIRLRSAGGAIGAGMLSIACGLAAGCGVAGATASHSAVVAARAKVKTHRFCADVISAATAAEQATIDRYWTPLARSALTVVSQGKMSVPVPKKHLTRAQRRALQRAEWAERAFGPKPRLECVQYPRAGFPPAPRPYLPSRGLPPGPDG